ncbi:hypothetical protein ElyMa_002120100 [Elysia marginata]|uniref:Tc1-like transposase DDE domain-containing protein n=1 Tax=Elysia marginata TaxID=1093978 RepID=A0AAV4FI23_9GAST|nr:hypothetical protein ElyMa_002120100 [Elysia marginata]
MLKRVRPNKHAILHRDNARPHTSRQTEETLNNSSYCPIRPTAHTLRQVTFTFSRYLSNTSEESITKAMKMWRLPFDIGSGKNVWTISPTACVNLYVVGSCVWVGMDLRKETGKKA